MRDSSKEVLYSPMDEARRYVDNARQTLKENGRLNVEFHEYEDRKYVRAAGHYLLHAVYIAIDAVFHVKNNPNRVDIDDYRSAVRNRDKKLLSLLNQAYDILHLEMGYDGVQNKTVCDEGFHLANEIIDRCSHLISNSECGTE